MALHSIVMYEVTNIQNRIFKSYKRIFLSNVNDLLIFIRMLAVEMGYL